MTTRKQKDSAFDYLQDQVKRAWLKDNLQAFLFNIDLLHQLWEKKEEPSGNNN